MFTIPLLMLSLSSFHYRCESSHDYSKPEWNVQDFHDNYGHKKNPISDTKVQDFHFDQESFNNNLAETLQTDVPSLHNIPQNTANETDEIVSFPMFHPFKFTHRIVKGIKSIRKALHPFLLLEETPKEFLEDVDDSSNLDPIMTQKGEDRTSFQPAVRTNAVDQTYLPPILPYPSSNKMIPNGVTVQCNNCNDYSEPDENDGYATTAILPLLSTIPENWHPSENRYEIYNCEDAPVSVNFIPGPWNNNYNSEYYQKYEIVPTTFNIPDHTDEPEFINEERIAKPTEERHFYHKHRPHLHAILHNIFHKHINSGPPQAPQYDYQTQHSNGATSTATELFHPFIQGEQVTINKQTFITPVSNTNGASNAQTVQITGGNNAISQTQKLDHSHNFQSTQIFGNHNSVSQSQAPYLREANSMLKTPFIFNVPYRRFLKSIPDTIVRRKRSTNYLIEDRLRRVKGVTDNDVLGKVNRPLIIRDERQVPLVKLATDPNAKVDVPKTLENVGTVVRNSFEHEEAPLHHVKNAVSSVRDALLSSLKIVPQDLVLPSKYKIVERGSETQMRSGNVLDNPVNPISNTDTLNNPADYILDTYQKIGNMLRESVRSTQDALAHLGEVIHNTRRAISATRNISPKFVHPSTPVHPIFEQRLHNNNTRRKLLLVTPRILELKHDTSEVVGAPNYLQSKGDFVSIGHVLDSLSVSNQDVQGVNWIQTSLFPFRNRQNTYVPAQFRAQQREAQQVEETLGALDNAKQVLGATSLRELLSKIRGTLRQKLDDNRKRIRVNVLPRYINSRSELQQPYRTMTEASGEPQANSYDLSNQPIQPPLTTDAASQENEIDSDNNNTPVGAINPIMYKKIVNESLDLAKPLDLESSTKIKDDPSIVGIPNTEAKIHQLSTSTNNNGEDSLGLSVKMGKKLLTPFMGKVPQQVVDVYYNDGVDRGYQNDFDDKNGYVGTRQGERRDEVDKQKTAHKNKDCTEDKNKLNLQ